MLNAITTRSSTPREDAELWPGGSARPVLAYLTGTLGMALAGARELLTAARTAQAEAGPGTLADYPVPGGGAHLLIHYAPGSRGYRFKLTTPENGALPGTSPEPGTAPGNRPGPDRPPGGRKTPDGSPAGDADGTPAPGLPAPPYRAAQPGPAEITVTIWHNVAHDGEGRHSAMLDGYRPGDPMVCVFTYQADPAGRSPETVAEEAFAICNGHPGNARGEELSRRYYQRELRSLSKGDVVVVGEVALAVASIGWTPVSGRLDEVRTREHGTSPLPLPGSAPGSRPRPAPRKADDGE